GGKSLHQLQKVCGLPGPDGSIQAFTPHDDEEEPYFGGDAATEDPGASVGGSGSRKWTVVVYIMAALVGILVSYVASATLIVRKVEGLWRLPFGGGVFEALCEGAAQCWRGFRRRCCCCCSCCFRGDDESPGDAQRPDFSERKLYGYTSATGEGRRLIFPTGGNAEETRRGRRGRSRGSRGGGGGSDGGGPRSSSPSRRTASMFYEDEEASRPRARSDSSGSGGGGGGGGGFHDDERLVGAAGAGSSASGRASAGGRRSNGYGTADGRGAASSAGGAGREHPRPAWAARRKRGGGVQILATSAVDAAAAAAKLAEEIANDDEV
ncbi:unnamed protein product, partial [Ectocarpus fasciculatus]